MAAESEKHWQRYLALADTVHDFLKPRGKTVTVKDTGLLRPLMSSFIKLYDEKFVRLAEHPSQVEENVMEELNKKIKLMPTTGTVQLLQGADAMEATLQAIRESDASGNYLSAFYNSKDRRVDTWLQPNLNQMVRAFFEIPEDLAPVFVLDANKLPASAYCFQSVCPIRKDSPNAKPLSSLFKGNSTFYDAGTPKRAPKSTFPCACADMAKDVQYRLTKLKSHLFGFDAISNLSSGENQWVLHFKSKKTDTPLANVDNAASPSVTSLAKALQSLAAAPSEQNVVETVAECVRIFSTTYGIPFNKDKPKLTLTDKLRLVKYLTDLKRAGDFMQVVTAMEYNQSFSSSTPKTYAPMIFVSSDRLAIAQARFLNVPCILTSFGKDKDEVGTQKGLNARTLHFYKPAVKPFRSGGARTVMAPQRGTTTMASAAPMRRPIAPNALPPRQNYRVAEGEAPTRPSLAAANAHPSRYSYGAHPSLRLSKPPMTPATGSVSATMMEHANILEEPMPYPISVMMDVTERGASHAVWKALAKAGTTLSLFEYIVLRTAEWKAI